MNQAIIPLTCQCDAPCDCKIDAQGRPLPTLFPMQRIGIYQALGQRIPFAHWQTSRPDDIGAMTLDWFASLADNLSFYSDQWVREQHLSSASQDSSLRQLANLTGFQPRPNLAARAQLVAIVDGNAPVDVAARLGISSEGNDEHGALPFETTDQISIDPSLNNFTAIMPRETVFDASFIAVGTAQRNLRTEEPVLFVSNDKREVAVLEDIETDKFPNGEAFATLSLDRTLTAFTGVELDQIQVKSFSNQVDAKAVSSTKLELAGIHPFILAGQDFVAIDMETGDLKHGEITARETLTVEEIPDEDHPVMTPVTRLRVNQTLTKDQAYVLFTKTKRGARLVGAPKTHATLSEFDGRILLREKYLGEATSYAGPFVVIDAQNQAVSLEGSLDIHPHSRRTSLDLTKIDDDAVTLTAPLTLYGNFIDVDQGKTVIETLGSSSGQRYQTFRLGKKPLTFIQRADGDPLPAIELYIDNVAWKYSPHLWDIAPEDQVYTLKLEADGQAHVILGGAAKIGNKNVTVRYRHGTTGENPLAHTVNKPDGRIAGVSKVFNPFQSVGGQSADTAEDIRHTLPARISANDRCVSATDFSVLAHNFGALSAHATPVWNPIRKRLGVQVMVIFDGGINDALADDLRAYLVAHAAEGSLVDVVQAQAHDANIHMILRASSTALHDDVTDAITKHLFDNYTGLLTPRRIEIGRSYNRSAILGPLANFDGLESILELSFDGDPSAKTMPVAPDEYLNATLELEFVT